MLEDQLEARRRALLEELADIQRRLRLLDTAQKRLRKDDSTMEYTVNRKTLPQRQAACLRMTIPTYDREGDLWHLMMQETAHLNLQPDDPCYCSVVFHDGEFKEKDVDVEAQKKKVKGTYPDTEHVTFRTLPRHLRLHHLSGPLRQDPRGQRRRGRLGSRQRLRLRRPHLQHLPRKPQRHPKPRGVCHRGLLPHPKTVTATSAPGVCISRRAGLKKEPVPTRFLAGYRLCVLTSGSGLGDMVLFCSR